MSDFRYRSKDFAGIQNVVRIESGFDGAMHVKHGRGELPRDLPGFRMWLGSSAALTARCMSSTAGESSR